MASSSRAAPSSRRRTIAAGAAVFLAAFALRWLGLGDAPMIPDEYYTVMAARSYAEEGVPRIGGGEYWRAPAFTALVAASLTAFGDSLAAARLPSALASALIVVVSFLWLRRAAGPAAAWLLALMLGLSGEAIGIGQFARFYALHALLYLVCAVAVYEWLQWRPGALAAGTGRARAVLLPAIAAVCAVAAWQLQQTTLIGLVALAVPASALLLARADVRAAARRHRTASAVALGALALLALAAVASGWTGRVWADYRWAAAWAAGNRDYPLYYVHVLARELPLLLYTFPLAFTAALARAPRPAFFCIALCVAAVLLHSFAGMKAIRYIHYLWPMLLVPFAIAGAALLAAVGNAADAVARRAAGVRPALARPLRIAPAAVIAAATTVALAGNPDFDKVRSLPVDVAAAFDRGPGAEAVRARAREERAMVEAIRAVVQSGGLFVTSSDLLALWHLGGFDLELRAGRLVEFEPGTEFSRDPRTGAIVIGTPDSLERIMRCRSVGTVVVWPGDWRRESRVTSAAADLIEATMEPIPLPGSQARAFRWHSTAAASPDCAQLVARP